MTTENKTTTATPPPLSAGAKAMGENPAEVIDAYWRRLCQVPGMSEDARLALVVAFQKDWLERVERRAAHIANAGASSPNLLGELLKRLPAYITQESLKDLIDRAPLLIENFAKGWAEANRRRGQS